MTALTVKDWLEDLTTNDNPIIADIADWTLSAFDYENGFTIKDVVRHLETTDCSACHAPGGLIYNVDLAAKLQAWWTEIDDALDAYLDATGEHWHPGLMRSSGGITSYVWFAVEWNAHELARLLESNAEDGTITDTPASDEQAV